MVPAAREGDLRCNPRGSESVEQVYAHAYSDGTHASNILFLSVLPKTGDLMSDDLEKAWVKYGALCGLSSVGIYLLLNVLVNIPGLPLSPVATRTAFFSVGVLGVASVGGVYHLIKKHKNSVMLQMAVLLSIVAFAFFTLMAVVQETTAVFWEESLANVESTADINSI